MAIVIKEIKVRTTIEKNLRQPALDERAIARMRKEIMREVREVVQRELNRKNER